MCCVGCLSLISDQEYDSGDEQWPSLAFPPFFLFKEYSWFSFYFYCILNFIIHLVCVCLWECMNGDAYHDILVVKGQLARVYSLRWQYGSWWGGTQITSLGGTGLPLPTAPSRRPGFSMFGNRCFYILCSFFFSDSTLTIFYLRFLSHVFYFIYSIY